jgi:hypothetical protein
VGIANAFQIVGTEQAHRVQLLLPEALLVAGRAALPDIQCDELAP